MECRPPWSDLRSLLSHQIPHHMHSSGEETWTHFGGYASSQQVAGMAQRAVLVVRGCWKSMARLTGPSRGAKIGVDQAEQKLGISQCERLKVDARTVYHYH